MSINLHIEADSMEHLLSELRTLVEKIEGGARSSTASVSAVSEKPEPEAKEAEAPAGEQSDDTPAEEPDPTQRRFGKVDGVHARRTKDQMAEDDEIATLADKLGVKLADHDMPATDLLAKLSEMAKDADQKSDEPKANISESPEDRKDPAEEPAGEATRDDMMKAMRAFVETHGMAEAQERMKTWTGGYTKQSEIPEDGALFAKIVARIEADHEELSNG